MVNDVDGNNKTLCQCDPAVTHSEHGVVKKEEEEEEKADCVLVPLLQLNVCIHHRPLTVLEEAHKSVSHQQNVEIDLFWNKGLVGVLLRLLTGRP